VFDSVQYENRVINSDFDMIIHTWANSLAPGNEQIYYFSANNANIKGSSNYIGLKDDVAEDLAIEITKVNDYPELVSTVHALDRYIMHLCLQVPLFYDNTTRYAYWFERIGIPTLSPKVGLNIMSWGWQKKDIAAATSTNDEPSIWQNIISWFKSLFSNK